MKDTWNKNDLYFLYQSEATIEFMESINGCSKNLKFQAISPCGSCRGGGGAPGSKLTKCSQCRGSGMQSVGGIFSTTCGACGGRGQKQSTPCPTCRGQKVVVESKTANISIPAGNYLRQLLVQN